MTMTPARTWSASIWATSGASWRCQTAPLRSRPFAARATASERVIDRLRATGLRTRLAATIAAIILAAAGATFVAVYRGTGAQVRSQIERDLATETASLEAQIA